MSPIDKELEEQIKKGVPLAKRNEEEMKKMEEEKKKRLAEIEALKKQLEGQG